MFLLDVIITAVEQLTKTCWRFLFMAQTRHLLQMTCKWR